MPRLVRPVVVAGSFLVILFAGCQPPEQKVVDRLPDPYFPKQERKAHNLAPPAPPPVVQRPPAIPYPQGGVEPGWMPRGGIHNNWKYVIVHHSAADKGSPQGIDAYHRQRGWDELGYHFVIGNGVDYPDGQVYVGSRWPKQKYGAHTRISKNDDNRFNLTGIGICLIGDFEHHRPTQKQMASLARLVTFLCRETHISLSQVVEHRDVDPHTRCAGRYFNLDQLKPMVAGRMRSGPVHASTN